MIFQCRRVQAGTSIVWIVAILSSSQFASNKKLVFSTAFISKELLPMYLDPEFLLSGEQWL